MQPPVQARRGHGARQLQEGPAALLSLLVSRVDLGDRRPLRGVRRGVEAEGAARVDVGGDGVVDVHVDGGEQAPLLLHVALPQPHLAVVSGRRQDRARHVPVHVPHVRLRKPRHQLDVQQGVWGGLGGGGGGGGDGLGGG